MCVADEGVLGYVRAVAKTVKRRKPAAERRTLYLRVRLTEEQHELFKGAAEHAGITMSAWATERLLRAARAEKRGKES